MSNWNCNTPIHFVGIVANFKPNPDGFCLIANYVNKFSSVAKKKFVQDNKRKCQRNAEIILKCNRHLSWNFPMKRDGGFVSLSKLQFNSSMLVKSLVLTPALLLENCSSKYFLYLVLI